MTPSPASVAVITGAGSPTGIGMAAARRLGADGARILITSTTDRIFERVAELRAHGIEAEGVVADLTGQAAWMPSSAPRGNGSARSRCSSTTPA
jgi:3-oxoacyl-[acyl-carrier protein] reductase